MKYVLVQTTYSPQQYMVVELYLTPVEAHFEYSTKLADAMIWNTYDEIANYVEAEKIHDYKIVSIEEKKLFKARLINN